MGSRANAVVIQDGKRHVYYAHWAAQFMDALAFWGPEHLLLEVQEWRDGREDDPAWDGEWWLDNTWAEGGCCIDFDNKLLLLYGGEDIACDVLWLETYLKLLPYTWPGWNIEWSWGELGQIARYAGIAGEKLEEIDCKITDYPSGKWLDEYVRNAFDVSEWQFPGVSTLSICREGGLRASFLDETEPENLLFIEGRVGEAVARLGEVPLVYDGGEFLMGGIHMDYDARSIWLWRTWNNSIEIGLPDYWRGWQLYDFHHDYRAFYHEVPQIVEFACRPETDYIEKIRNWVLNGSLEDFSRGMKLEERKRILAEVLGRYREDNPSQVFVPDLEGGGEQR